MNQENSSQTEGGVLQSSEVTAVTGSNNSQNSQAQREIEAVMDVILEVDATFSANIQKLDGEKQDLAKKSAEVASKFSNILVSTQEKSESIDSMVTDIAATIVNSGHGSRHCFYGNKNTKTEPSIFLKSLAETWFTKSCYFNAVTNNYSYTVREETISWSQFEEWYGNRSKGNVWRSCWRTFQNKMKQIGLTGQIDRFHAVQTEANKAVVEPSTSEAEEKDDDEEEEAEEQEEELEEDNSKKRKMLKSKKLIKLAKIKVSELREPRIRRHMLYFIWSNSKKFGKGGYTYQTIDRTLSRYELVDAMFKGHFEPFGEELNHSSWNKKVEEAFFYIIDLYFKHPLRLSVSFIRIYFTLS
jgi:hypothetical protein